MQAVKPEGAIDHGAIKTAQLMVSRYGVLGLFRGITAVAVGAGWAKMMTN